MSLEKDQVTPEDDSSTAQGRSKSIHEFGDRRLFQLDGRLKDFQELRARLEAIKENSDSSNTPGGSSFEPK